MDSRDILSVYDPVKEEYVYFQTPRIPKPLAHGRPKGGIPLEEALPRVPSGCRCVGRGEAPMGTIATVSDPGSGTRLWFLLGLGALAFLLWSTR